MKRREGGGDSREWEDLQVLQGEVSAKLTEGLYLWAKPSGLVTDGGS